MKSNLPDRRDMLLPLSLWERMASAASQVRACRGAATIRYVVHPCDTTPLPHPPFGHLLPKGEAILSHAPFSNSIGTA